MNFLNKFSASSKVVVQGAILGIDALSGDEATSKIISVP